MTPQLGLLLALGCAFFTNLAFLWKQKGAVAAPEVELRHPLASAKGLFRSKWFVIGFSVAIAAWVLHVAALALAPISLVQAVISGGLVFLAVLADRWFGFTLGRRQWWGVAFVAAGLAFLGLTAEHTGLSLELLDRRNDRLRGRDGRARGCSSSSPTGSSSGSSASVTVSSSRPRPESCSVSPTSRSRRSPVTPASILGPWTLVAVLASIGAFYASAHSLQLGDGVSVIATTSVAANASAILGGILVFGDPIGGDALAIVARSAAFALVIAATALMPAPIRAASRTA